MISGYHLNGYATYGSSDELKVEDFENCVRNERDTFPMIQFSYQIENQRIKFLILLEKRYMVHPHKSDVF